MGRWTFVIGTILGAVLITISNMNAAFAADVPQSFTLDGRLYSDAGGTTPLQDGAIAFTIQILDDAKVCVVYEESQTISTAASKGYFSMQVGTIVGSPLRTAGDSANSMPTIFQNMTTISGKLLSNGAPCTVSATGGNRRYVRVKIAPPTMGGAARTLSPDLTIDSVPNAIVAERAESLQGLRATNVLQVNTSGANQLSQTNLESLFTSTTRFNSLTAVVDGTSTNYMRSQSSSGANLPVMAGAPTLPVPGAIWYDSSDSKVKFQTSVGPVIVGTGSGTVTSVGFTAPSELSVANSPVTTTGTIAVTWATQTANKVFASPDGATGTPSFRVMVANDIPNLPWTKITSLLPTTLLGYGITDAVKNNGGTPSLESGLNAAKGAATTAGRIWISTDTKEIYRDNGATWDLIGTGGAGSGTVTSVSSTNSYLSVATATTTPALTLNVGTAANTVAAGNDSRITGALQSATAFSGDVSGAYNATSVDKIKGKMVSPAAYASGQFLKYDGTDWVNALLSASDVTTALTYTPVNKAGDTMTGLLVLSADPSANLNAATKQYVDSATATVQSNAQTYADTKFITKTLPAAPAVGQNGQSIRWNNGSNVWEYYTPGAGAGDVVGPASSTDNAIARFDGTTGKLVQNSSVVIDDSGNVGVGTNSPSNPLHVNSTTNPQMKISYDASNAVTVGMDSVGQVHFNATGLVPGYMFSNYLSVTENSFNPTAGIYLTRTNASITPASHWAGTYTSAVRSGDITGGATDRLYGDRIVVSRTGASNLASLITYGSYAQVTSTGAVGGNPSTDGYNTLVTADTGGSSTAAGFRAYVTGADTIYGAHFTVLAPASTTAYGLYVDAGAGAGTEYAASFMNGNVGIGTTTPGSRLEVTSSPTATTGTIAGQQVNYTWAPSAAAGGATGVGDLTTVSSTSNRALGTLAGEQVNVTYSPTSTGGTTWLQGSSVSLTASGAGSGGPTFMIGQQSDVTYSMGGLSQAKAFKGSANLNSAGTLGTAYGLDALITTSTSGSAVISNAYGVSSQISSSSGSITTAYGIYSDLSQSGGAIQTGYGVYIGNVQATNKWSLYANDAAAPSYFAGSVGVGTTSPGARLDVADTGTTTSAIIVPRAGNFTGTNVDGMIRYNTASTLFEFRQNGSWVNYTTVSDGRLKTNVVPVVDGLGIVNRLNPVFYDWDRNNPKASGFEDKHQLGFIAQEVESVLPEVVNQGADSYRSLEYGKIVSVVVAAVKELYSKVLGIDAHNAEQDREIASVKASAAIEKAASQARAERLEAENQALKARLDQQDRDFKARLDQQDRDFKARLEQQDRELKAIKQKLGL